MAAYATPADMINRFDLRTLGDLCSDVDGVPVVEGLLHTNPKLLAALNTASGKIKAGCLRAGRYTAQQLTDLTGESLDYLKDMTCRLAFWALWQRKPYADDQQRKQWKEDADEILAMLRSGDEVFEIAAVIEAGHPTIETVSRIEIQRDWDLAVDQARGRFYPRRRSYRQR